jgi:uncharacterized protein YecT (DUF1311 family)
VDSTEIERQIEVKVQKLRQLLSENELTKEELLIEFQIDTFKIEEKKRQKLYINYSTNRMIIVLLDANKEYDKLLNKYYIQLINSLNETDREVLKKSQRNWIEFRKSEKELNSVLMNDYFSGGGTIQRVIATSKVLDITKDRVIELYRYLSRKSQ